MNTRQKSTFTMLGIWRLITIIVILIYFLLPIPKSVASQNITNWKEGLKYYKRSDVPPALSWNAGRTPPNTQLLENRRDHDRRNRSVLLINTQSLWGESPSGKEIKIPILGLCGEFFSGKTHFAITIALGNHPEGHPFAGMARTGVIDTEKSSETYEASGLGFKRFDLPAEVLKKYPGGYNPSQFYEEFRRFIDLLPNGRFDVLVVDSITDIDTGVTEYVKQNPTKFGLTAKQIERTSALFWAVVKELWNQIFLQLAAKAKTFVFTAHMRDVYVGNTPSGKREPKGKETYMKLATLYLELQRKSNAKGEVPTVPRAVCHKSRLSDIRVLEFGEIETVQLIPKVFDDCTPARIRQLLANPVSESEAFEEEHLTPDMRLAYSLALETQRNEANQVELELTQRKERLTMAYQKSVNCDLGVVDSVETPSLNSQSTNPQEQTVAESQAEWGEIPAPEAWDVEDIKKAVANNDIHREDLKHYLDSKKVAKVGDLTKSQLKELAWRVGQLMKACRIAEHRGIPVEKIREFAEVSKAPTPIEMSKENLEKIVGFMENVPEKN